MSRLALVDHRRRICFFHSQKCASANLSAWLMRHVLLTSPSLGKTDLVRRVFGADMRSAASLVTDHGYFSVALVRHPATRLLSGFAERFLIQRAVREADKSAKDGEETKSEEAKSEETPACENKERSWPEFEGTSFSDLLDHVEENLRQGEHSELAPQFNQQVHPRHDVYGLRFDHVCAVETLHEDFAPIEDYFGVPDTFPPAKPGAFGSDGRGGEGFQPDALLTVETLERIGRIYARDFETFGYDPADPTAPPAIRQFNGFEIEHGHAMAPLEPARERRTGWSWFGLRRA